MNPNLKILNKIHLRNNQAKNPKDFSNTLGSNKSNLNFLLLYRLMFLNIKVIFSFKEIISKDFIFY